MEVVRLPAHSQSVERCAKLVTETLNAVYGLAGRHKFLTATVISRIARPDFESKCMYEENYSKFLQ